jgi:hypothetical protein
VILVDDGLATGASMRAAVRAVRPRAKQVTIAVPVAARSSVDEIGTEADRVICVSVPERLEAVSLFYRDFSPTTDDEVRALLADAGKRQGTGIREQGTENRDQRTENREQGSGNRDQGTGIRKHGSGIKSDGR